ncbi:MAG: pyrroline-5-carboxylate reductase [Candidatus Omnitrophota bacterium]
MDKALKNIGIIGFGNMGQAIAGQLKDDYKIFVFDKDLIKLQKSAGVNISASPRQVLDSVSVVILAVKPQDFAVVLNEIKDNVNNKLIVSIAAGITTDYIEKILGVVSVIRVMPNMPVRVNAGISCLCSGKFASEEDLDFVENLFDYLGETLRIEENMMNAATAVSGSGPGFFYELIEGRDIKGIKQYAQKEFILSLISAAEDSGFNLEQARILAENTAKGSIAVLEKIKISPAELKNQVVSKGGTTEAGLKVLRGGGSLGEAVKAAIKRAEELSFL